jgi:hypothetical protein
MVSTDFDFSDTKIKFIGDNPSSDMVNLALPIFCKKN